jgi:transposase-like protein
MTRRRKITPSIKRKILRAYCLGADQVQILANNDINESTLYANVTKEEKAECRVKHDNLIRKIFE